MNIRKKLTLRFVLHSVVAGLIVLLIAGLTVFWVMQRFSDISLSNNFASIGLERLVESSTFDADGITFDVKLLEQVKENGGWLQSLDEAGNVESSYHTPKDVPLHYGPGEFVAYWNGEQDFPYNLYLWIQEKNGRLYTLLYGVPKIIQPVLDILAKTPPAYSGGKPHLPTGLTEKLMAKEGYIQLLDAEGKEVASLNRPSSVPVRYSVQELALRSEYGDRYGYYTSTVYHADEKMTYVVGSPVAQGNKTGLKGSGMQAETEVLLLGIAGMLAATLLLLALLSLYNAHQFGTPILHMLAWLDALGKGRFTEPYNRNKQPLSRHRSGKWKKRYRIFADVMRSLDTLSGILQRDRELRRQTEVLREEWITGITHDLKTPLSSIKGYAHLLAEGHYDWSPEEVRRFSGVMLEKSAHIDKLISDLDLTYRIKSGISPPQMELIELNGWLENALDQAGANPAYGEGRIRFVSAGKEIWVRLYAPWLERVVNNLTANALLHNSPDTRLDVILTADEEAGLSILFRDNGQGMDELTKAHLFERYYRGVDTLSTTHGSGLGMAVSKGLIEAMGGEIAVQSTPGSGTDITLSWEKSSAVRVDSPG
ncbi:sensor histidine kinase YvrG [Paenibacillus albidus]|uniref:histidine kinase n=1 Tax=Paenibacillus albidus TaxID=2041023 RepID=A0A917C160_9BACL|nr:HAMP domain-containing sensor histidine kinase [Paenibacillus albidus]GGF67273.1 sensor histidine kinase YvrG [Paenibacillus albidus]